MKTSIIWLALVMLALSNTFAQIPSVTVKNGRYLLLVDGKPYFIFGGQAHNSSAWPGMMPQVWQAVKSMHANTLEIPVYWEQVETQPGKFDFSFLDTLLTQARRQNIRLVLLWFGTWKNGSNHYMPGWMKQETIKYPNITTAKGQPIDSPSPNIPATLNADIKAFSALMTYLKQADIPHTVIMIQVENEAGSWGSIRDHSSTAQKLFEGPVPTELLKPANLKNLNMPPGLSGSWQHVFGDRADEYFQAWSISRFIGQVAAAGKAVYPLPMYTNAALRDPFTNPMATSYESGGPTDNVIPIWKIAAPALDLLGPDIYLSGSDRIMKVIDLYDRPDNALMVPEIGLVPENSKYIYEVIARGGIGFSPFGIDDNNQHTDSAGLIEKLAPFARDYVALADMMTQLAQWSNEGRIKAAIEREDHAPQTIDLGAWEATVSFGEGGGLSASKVNSKTNGNMLIIRLSDNKFMILGSQSHITFKPLGRDTGKAWQFLKVEEGSWQNNIFNPLRTLNGDETDFGGPRFGPTPTLVQISLGVR